MSQAFGRERKEEDLDIADMITIAFFFVLRSGDYTGTTSYDTSFRLEDVALYIRDRRLYFMTASFAELDPAASVSYDFTTQKNVTWDEKLVQGLSGDGKCCPVKATVRRIKYHRAKNSKQTVPIASYCWVHRRTEIKAKDITETLRHSMTMNYHHTGIHASEISARTLRAWGAMAMMYSKIDMKNIRMMGRWHSDAMVRYLHVQAQPIIECYAAKMFNNGTYISSNPTKLFLSLTNTPTHKHPRALCTLPIHPFELGPWGQYHSSAAQLDQSMRPSAQLGSALVPGWEVA
jgi:hypothetical protein